MKSHSSIIFHSLVGWALHTLKLQNPNTTKNHKAQLPKTTNTTIPAPEMASLLHLRHPHSVFNLSSSSPTLLFLHSPHHIPLKPSHSTSITLKFLHFRPHTAPFALTDSDSPKSLSPNPETPQTLLQELAVSFFPFLFCYFYF